MTSGALLCFQETLFAHHDMNKIEEHLTLPVHGCGSCICLTMFNINEFCISVHIAVFQLISLRSTELHKLEQNVFNVSCLIDCMQCMH